MLQSPAARLVILALVHFVVDFCGGLLIPLPEPTLTTHLGVGLPAVALLLGGCALLVNVVQPVSGWLLPQRGVPILLVLGPAMAATVTLIGLTHTIGSVTALLIVSGVGIGMVHPEGSLAAHSILEQRKGWAVSLFMSGGYFGFALGSLVGGLWAVHAGPGLGYFWVLGALPVAVAVLVVRSGLHRLEGHVVEERAEDGEGRVPFAIVLMMAISVAVAMGMLVRFTPILMVRRFPGHDAQAWAGATVFAYGVSGVLGSLVWGHFSDRWGRGRTIAGAQLLGLPFLYLWLHAATPWHMPLWAVGTGLTAGGVFPLCVVLARESRGLAQRLRMGLAIGGTWGLGEVAFMMGGKYAGFFPDGDARPISAVLRLCWIFLGGAATLAVLVAVRERKNARR